MKRPSEIFGKAFQSKRLRGVKKTEQKTIIIKYVEYFTPGERRERGKFWFKPIAR